ncbi:MAG TPA: hypothetical protein VI299_27280 [Polyangiales bacterium]
MLRALSLFMLAELSGLGHIALDAMTAEVVGADDCQDGDHDHECPPGCTNCHCWHAGLAGPQLSAAIAPSRAVQLAAGAPPPAYARTQPNAPDQAALYRPPRTLALI